MRDRRGDAVLVGILEDSLLGVREGLCARARRAEEARRRRREGRDAEDDDQESPSDASTHRRWCPLDTHIVIDVAEPPSILAKGQQGCKKGSLSARIAEPSQRGTHAMCAKVEAAQRTATGISGYTNFHTLYPTVLAEVESPHRRVLL